MKYLIVGGGVAGTSAATKIRELDATGEIDILSEEVYPFYSRPRLPEIFGGDATPEDLIVRKPRWYEEKAIKLHLGETVQSIDAAAQTIATANDSYSYDRLLLSTGSRSFVPPVKGAEKEGVFTLRSMADALTIKETSKKARSAVLIGGGLLGLEAGNGLRRAGLKVTVVEVFPRLLPRQMDEPGAAVLVGQMEEMGFSFRLGVQSEATLGEGHVQKLVLSTGEELTADLILISAGVRPNVDLAKALGLTINKGVIVDDRMETSQTGVFAAGDPTEHRGVIYGIWPASQRQGEVAGVNMAGGNQAFDGIVPNNRLKVVGIDLISVGEIDVDNKYEALVSETSTSYRKLVLKDDVLIGCILLGDSRGSSDIMAAIERKACVGSIKSELGAKGFDFKRLRQL